MPARRMNCGVGSSGSPTQKARMSLRPMPSLYSSRILDAVSARTAARAAMGVSGFIRPHILDCRAMRSGEPWSKAQLSLAAALATMFVWGVNFAFVKHVLDGIGVEALMFVRFAVLPLLGFALLLVIFRRRIRHTWPRRRDLSRFVVAGLIGHAAHIGVVMYGMSLSTPFSSSLVLTSGPLFTLIILAILKVERRRGRPGAASRRAPIRAVHGARPAAHQALRTAHRPLLHAPLLGAADPPRHPAWLPRHTGKRVHRVGVHWARLGAGGVVVLRLARVELGQRGARRGARCPVRLPYAPDRGPGRLAHAGRSLHLAQDRGRGGDHGRRGLCAVRRRRAGAGSRATRRGMTFNARRNSACRQDTVTSTRRT